MSPSHWPPSACRAQRGTNGVGCKEDRKPFSPKGSRSPAVGRRRFYWCGCERRGGPSQPVRRAVRPLGLGRSQQEGSFSLLPKAPAGSPFASSNLSPVPRARTLAVGRRFTKLETPAAISAAAADPFTRGTDDRGIGFCLMPPRCSAFLF